MKTDKKITKRKSRKGENSDNNDKGTKKKNTLKENSGDHKELKELEDVSPELKVHRKDSANDNENRKKDARRELQTKGINSRRSPKGVKGGKSKYDVKQSPKKKRKRENKGDFEAAKNHY